MLRKEESAPWFQDKMFVAEPRFFFMACLLNGGTGVSKQAFYSSPPGDFLHEFVKQKCVLECYRFSFFTMLVYAGTDNSMV